ncbi:MAG: hypothetical protein K0U12_06695 [Gammaproteobacteria bacterium]|nr:hypothetical protein [Gammaproteobacteria bacterium]
MSKKSDPSDAAGGVSPSAYGTQGSLPPTGNNDSQLFEADQESKQEYYTVKSAGNEISLTGEQETQIAGENAIFLVKKTVAQPVDEKSSATFELWFKDKNGKAKSKAIEQEAVIIFLNGLGDGYFKDEATNISKKLGARPGGYYLTLQELIESIIRPRELACSYKSLYIVPVVSTLQEVSLRVRIIMLLASQENLSLGAQLGYVVLLSPMTLALELTEMTEFLEDLAKGKKRGITFWAVIPASALTFLYATSLYAMLEKDLGSTAAYGVTGFCSAITFTDFLLIEGRMLTENLPKYLFEQDVKRRSGYRRTILITLAMGIGVMGSFAGVSNEIYSQSYDHLEGSIDAGYAKPISYFLALFLGNNFLSVFMSFKGHELKEMLYEGWDNIQYNLTRSLEKDVISLQKIDRLIIYLLSVAGFIWAVPKGIEGFQLVRECLSDILLSAEDAPFIMVPAILSGLSTMIMTVISESVRAIKLYGHFMRWYGADKNSVRSQVLIKLANKKIEIEIKKKQTQGIDENVADKKAAEKKNEQKEAAGVGGVAMDGPVATQPAVASSSAAQEQKATVADLCTAKMKQIFTLNNFLWWSNGIFLVAATKNIIEISTKMDEYNFAEAAWSHAGGAAVAWLLKLYCVDYQSVNLNNTSRASGAAVSEMGGSVPTTDQNLINIDIASAVDKTKVFFRRLFGIENIAGTGLLLLFTCAMQYVLEEVLMSSSREHNRASAESSAELGSAGLMGFVAMCSIAYLLSRKIEKSVNNVASQKCCFSPCGYITGLFRSRSKTALTAEVDQSVPSTVEP